MQPEGAKGGPVLEFRAVSRRFGGMVAVDRVDLQVVRGEFLTLLGPSGCGKTTMLRLMAGFEQPDDGDILLDGASIKTTPPHRRGIGMVFQNYALFPHLDVKANVAFGLEMRGVPAGERRERVVQALEMVGLGALGDRSPHQLSGGQRQRVALARALVVRPAMLLLDEPLGALDLSMRRLMQAELKQIQRRSGTTFVFVTHDQEEALSMSDRIAVCHGGRIEQLATPEEIYLRPATHLVASLVGEANLLPARADRDGIRIDPLGISIAPRPDLSGDVTVVVRPEHVAIGSALTGSHLRSSGSVVDVSFGGSTITYSIVSGSASLSAKVPFVGGDTPAQVGTTLEYGWLPGHCTFVSGHA